MSRWLWPFCLYSDRVMCLRHSLRRRRVDMMCEMRPCPMDLLDLYLRGGLLDVT